MTAAPGLPTNRPALPPPRRSGPPGGWLLLAAAVAALIVLITLSVAYVRNPSAEQERITSPGPPPLSAPSPSPTPTPAGVAAEPAGTDVTARFREFALVGEKFPPEWLVRTKRVYWSADGSLWADASMPRNARERAFTIESICEELSAYVVEVVRRDWPGVSVRDERGAELITRARPADSCRPGL